MSGVKSDGAQDAPAEGPVWPLGLAWLSCALSRDLQRASRVAGGPEALWGATRPQMAAWLRADADVLDRALAARGTFRAASVRASLAGRGILHLPITANAYPTRLRRIFDPPFGLFGVGSVATALSALEHSPAIAIVGSRRPSGAGRRLAAALAADLASRGAVIVSGLARGIDAAAHEGALEAGGVTIAVLGSAVDRIHPRRHVGLADRIQVNGAVVSEYWPGTDPLPWRFPARNRIVAGLCDATVVVEAGARSGALITADFAMENGSTVLAVPGWPASSLSTGCNALIRSGAAVCEAADDVVREVPNGAWAEARVAPSPTGTTALVLAIVTRGPAGADAIAAEAGITHAEVAVALAALELDGLVAREPGGVFGAVGVRGRGAGA